MPLNEEYNYSQNKLGLIQSGSQNYDFPGQDGINGDNINLSIYKEEAGSINYIESFNTLDGDFHLISDYSNTFHIKPNDLLNEFGYSSGNYNLTFNFTRNIFKDLQSATYCPEVNWDNTTHTCSQTANYPNVLSGVTDPYFWISEISPTRKEIRVLGRHNKQTDSVDDLPFIDSFQKAFLQRIGTLDQTDEYPNYEFNWVLNFGEDRYFSVNNITFDNVSDPDFSSLIIRTEQALPTSILVNSQFSIEKEL